jgi:NAD(P)H-dependent FMN reductase
LAAEHVNGVAPCEGVSEREVDATMTNLIGRSGSLRHGSLNSALLRSAAELAPDGAEIAIRTIRGIPLYDGDVEAAEGIPEPVRSLKEAIGTSDGLLLVTPEDNNSIPGVLKNAIDRLSRPPADIKRVFGGKPVALMGASPGASARSSARMRGFRSSALLARSCGPKGAYSSHARRVPLTARKGSRTRSSGVS